MTECVNPIDYNKHNSDNYSRIAMDTILRVIELLTKEGWDDSNLPENIDTICRNMIEAALWS